MSFHNEINAPSGEDVRLAQEIVYGVHFNILFEEDIAKIIYDIRTKAFQKGTIHY